METEEEQVEKLKAWLKENGMSIVAGIVIGVGGLGGYRYWDHLQKTTAEQASSHFTQMIEALDSKNNDDLQQHAQMLIDEYSSTEYALMAQFAMAKNYISNKEFDKAEQSLRQVVGSAGQEPLGYLARTRLASVQMQREQFDQALSTLESEFPPSFAAGVDELRGDILARQGKTAAAQVAYRRAQQAQPGPANVEFLRQKIEDLGVAG